MSAEPVAELARITGSTEALADQAVALWDEHKDVEVTSRPQFLEVSEVLRSVKGLQKGLEAERVKVTGPLNVALKQVNDWFRGPSETLAKAERAIKNALGKFEAAEAAEIRRQEEEARRQAAKEAEELRARAARAEAAGRVEKAAELQTRAAAVVPATPALAPVKARGMAFTDVWDVKVIDAKLVPDQFWVIDEAKIRAVVKATKGDPIPGVEITHRRDVRSGT